MDNQLLSLNGTSVNLDITSLDVNNATTQLLTLVKEGNIDPLQVNVFVKKLAKIAETVTKDEDFRDISQKEFLKHNQKMCKLFGVEISYTAVHTFYDYSECGHSEYNELAKIKKYVDARMKELEKEMSLLNENIGFNKTSEEDFTIATNTKDVLVKELPVLSFIESGSVDTIYPPVKKQKMGLKFNKL